MTGVFGLFGCDDSMRRGVTVGEHGAVIVRGPKVGYGAAIAAGEGGTVINGLLDCADYNTSAAGGCFEGGNRPLVVGPSAVIQASGGFCGSAGCVLNAYNITMLGGTVQAAGIHTLDSGGVLAVQTQIIMTGKAKVIARRVHSDAGGSIAACQNLSLSGSASIVDVGGWGGDAGAIQSDKLVTLADNARIMCEQTHADSCGGCISSSIIMSGNASVIARGTSAQSVGGALGGCYPNQNIVVRDAATIDVQHSSAQQAAGALFAHNISASGGHFSVTLRNTSAGCGGAIAVINSRNELGQGNVFIDGTAGGAVTISDAKELDESKGCQTIMGSLSDPGGLIPQPCSDCSAGQFPRPKRPACTCTAEGSPRNRGGRSAAGPGSGPVPVTECCTYEINPIY
jgi:hypothetical protein